MAFSGWADVNTALAESNAVKASVPNAQYLDIGGGNENGKWTASQLNALNNAISQGRISGWAGICYDIELGDSGLSGLFAASFAAAKRMGLKVLVTVSHSQPYGIADGAALMTSILQDINVDYISPQLYTGGGEAANDYTVGSGALQWSAYKTTRARIIPAIVKASYYPSAQAFFQAQGITLAGFIQWDQARDTAAAPLSPSPNPIRSPIPSPTPTTGCPAGWSQAVGTLYDSWPKPGTVECVDYSGCRWAGMFKAVNGGTAPNCINGAQYLPSPDYVSRDCRFPESLVKSWNMAATYELDSELLGKKVGSRRTGARAPSGYVVTGWRRSPG